MAAKHKDGSDPKITLAITADYRQFVEELKSRVATAHLFAARRINQEMIFLYWDIGREIVMKQQALGWGESVVEILASDLQRSFPAAKGFSSANIWRMRQFYLVHNECQFLAQVVREMEAGPAPHHPKPFLPHLVAEIGNPYSEPNLAQAVRDFVSAVPWGHHVLMLGQMKSPEEHFWYLSATARFGWSRNVLLNQIKAGAYERAVTEKKTHNFDLALPEHFAEQADEMLKSSYLNLLNDKERGPGDQPSIGIILCAEKDDVEVEYALRTKANPVGVAAYALQSKLPGELKGKLPTAKQLADIVRAEMEGGK